MILITLTVMSHPRTGNTDTKKAKPIFTKMYRHPQIHKQELKAQVNKMLDQGIIEPSSSPWSSPVWVIP